MAGFSTTESVTNVPERGHPPPYGLLGASTGVELPISRQVLALSVEGNNLTNTSYRDYTSLLRYYADEPGWELVVRLRLDFDAG